MHDEELFQRMVQDQIGGYEFKNPLLLKQAFTRKSYTAENGGENNEVLEFIGDKVLDIAVVRFLAKVYGTDLHFMDKIQAAFRVPQDPEEFACELSEGELTKLKQRMVEKKALARRIDELRFAQFLVVGKGDEKKEVWQEDSVKEDLFEAIIGAVALDSNWDFEKLQEVVEIMLCPESFLEDDEEADYVGLIHEWEDRKNNTTPLFRYPNHGYSFTWYVPSGENVICQQPNYSNLGNYRLNNLNYTCQVKLLNDLPVFEAYGTSKAEARKNVCEFAYKYLEDHDLLYDIHDEIENPCLEEAIGQLEILARRGYFNIPEYTADESHNKDGNPVWHVECHIEGMDTYYFAEGFSKKQAKKEAAYEMLSYILDLDEEE